jgi:hypothetical protein
MEHADDLPSERADDAAANAQVDLQDELSDDNAFDSDDDSDGIHEDHCSRHTSDLAAKCIGKTYAGKKCRYRGRIVKEGFFPVCGQHIWHQKQAGRCQAIEKCGHPCNRLTAFTPPYFFCDKHEHGITSIPCHIICLPTELRLMIFRYVLPDVIPAASYFDKGHMAIMMVNRQFYMEASAIVYGELKFEAVVQPTYIALFGRQWHRESVDRTYVELDKQLCQAGARRIRHLEVTIQFGDKHKKINGIGVASVSHEDYEVYQVRDTVRKLVQLMAPEPSSSESMALRQLDVKPEPGPRQRWESDEVIAAIFFVLEPLLALASIDDVTLQAPPRPFHYSWKYLATAAAVGGLQTNKEFLQLRKQWVESMQSSSSGTGVKQHPKVTKAGVGTPYGTIEKFARLIYSEDAAQAQGRRCLVFMSYHWSDCLQAKQSPSTAGHRLRSKALSESCILPEWPTRTATSRPSSRSTIPSWRDGSRHTISSADHWPQSPLPFRTCSMAISRMLPVTSRKTCSHSTKPHLLAPRMKTLRSKILGLSSVSETPR